MGSLQDVFKDFEYENDDASTIQEESFFHETFSQLKGETVIYSECNTRTSSSRPSNLVDFEEAFTALKSIRTAHNPSSLTAITAYLHCLRGLHTNRRTLQGLMWPEHPETFSSSRLLEESLASTATGNDYEGESSFTEIIPQLYSEPLESSDTEVSSSAGTGGFCEMIQSRTLHKSLVRACQSIWRERFKYSPEEISPHLSHVISRRCSFLLQTVLKRAHLNRRSAVKLLHSFPDNFGRDLDNVPVDWVNIREATKQTIGQASLDQDTFVKFKMRLDKLFKQQ